MRHESSDDVLRQRWNVWKIIFFVCRIITHQPIMLRPGWTRRTFEYSRRWFIIWNIGEKRPSCKIRIGCFNHFRDSYSTIRFSWLVWAQLSSGYCNHCGALSSYVWCISMLIFSSKWHPPHQFKHLNEMLMVPWDQDGSNQSSMVMAHGWPNGARWETPCWQRFLWIIWMT